MYIINNYMYDEDDQGRGGCRWEVGRARVSGGRRVGGKGGLAVRLTVSGEGRTWMARGGHGLGPLNSF